MGANEPTLGCDAERLAESVRLLAGRRSIRRYLPQPIAREMIDALLEAAVTAPSAHNRQPWRFEVLTQAERKHGLALAMGARLRADRLRDGDASAVVEADVARSYARLSEAPAVIVVCLSMQDMDRYGDEGRGRAEYLMAVQGTAMAVQNLLLAAHAAGLGACWMCAPLFCSQAVSQALDLPADWQPQALVTLGYPAAPGKPFSRTSARALTRVDGAPA